MVLILSNYRKLKYLIAFFSPVKKWIKKVDLSTISAKHNTSEFMERQVKPMLRGKLEYVFSVLSNDVGRYCHL